MSEDKNVNSDDMETERERLVFAAFVALEELLALEAPEEWTEYQEARRLAVAARQLATAARWVDALEASAMAAEFTLYKVNPTARTYFVLREEYPEEWKTYLDERESTTDAEPLLKLLKGS